MQLPESYIDGNPSPTRSQLQGPRPPQLRVRKDSHLIKKPPVAPHQQAPRQRPEEPTQNRRPVIIYDVSPEVIHTTVTDFMSLVQRLTGSSSSSSGDFSTASIAATNRGDVSPAGRLALIERTSPKERERDREIANNDIMGLVEGIEMGQNPGILSPAPATLRPISPGFFSPGSDPQAFSILQDLSPFNLDNMFMTSPSTLFSAPMVSPSPSSFDLFNQFLNF